MGKRAILWIVAVVLVVANAVWGKIIYVDDDAPAGGNGTSWATAYRFLQDALADAESAVKPVEVRVAGGLYKPDASEEAPHGTGDRYERFKFGDGVSLIGGYAGTGAGDPNGWDPEAYETILSGDLAGNDAEVTDPTLLRYDPTRDENAFFGVLELANGKTVLSGCSITGGAGAGVRLEQYPMDLTNDVTISDCRFYGNRGNDYSPLRSGALSSGLSTIESHVVVRRCSFIGNAGWSAGALGCSGVVQQCQFMRNHAWGAGDGGAASVGRNSIVSDCVFTGNSANGNGGALEIGSSLSVSRVVRCVFRNNSAEGGGGVVCDGSVEVRDCLFIGNSASVGGGGLDRGRMTKVANCLFLGNQSRDPGGAWYTFDRSSLMMVGCTAWGNRAPEGAFLAVNYNTEKNSDKATILNCLLHNGDDEIWSDNSPVSIAYTCFAQGLGDLSDAADWLSLGPGIIEADPCLVNPAYWDDNGTPDDPNDDFFVEGDCHLKSQAGRWEPASGSWVRDDVTSPCIDAGDPNSPIMYEPFPNGGIINMGVYGGTAEASKSYFGQLLCETIIVGDINGDCKVDIDDLVLLMRHWLEVRDQMEVNY